MVRLMDFNVIVFPVILFTVMLHHENLVFADDFFVSSDKMSYSAAFEFCANHGGSMIVFQNEKEYNETTDWVWNYFISSGDTGNKAYWTDMRWKNNITSLPFGQRGFVKWARDEPKSFKDNNDKILHSFRASKSNSDYGNWRGKEKNITDGSEGFAVCRNDSVCGASPTRQYGYLTSPNYPVPYKNNEACNSKITVEEGYTIQITFVTSFDVEYYTDCPSDYVEISEESYQTSKLCGGSLDSSKIKDFNFYSYTNEVNVKFTTDLVSAYSGWRLLWQAIPACVAGSAVPTSSGLISSPGSPNQYENSIKCATSIIAPTGSTINVKFEKFSVAVDTNSTGDCGEDTLMVFQDHLEVGELCGDILPFERNITNNKFMVVFQTGNDGLVGGGWKIKWKAFSAVVPSSTSSSTTTSSLITSTRKHEIGSPWVSIVMILLILILGLAIGFVVFKQQKRRKRMKGILNNEVSVHMSSLKRDKESFNISQQNQSYNNQDDTTEPNYSTIPEGQNQYAVVQKNKILSDEDNAVYEEVSEGSISSQQGHYTPMHRAAPAANDEYSIVPDEYTVVQKPRFVTDEYTVVNQSVLDDNEYTDVRRSPKKIMDEYAVVHKPNKMTAIFQIMIKSTRLEKQIRSQS